MPTSTGVVLADDRVSRRLLDQPEVVLQTTDLGQVIDVDLTLASGEQALPNMDAYPKRSLESGIAFMRDCSRHGVSRFMVRFIHGGYEGDVSFDSCSKRLETQAEAIRSLREAIPAAEIVIDPFGLALGSDDKWGVQKQGQLSLHKTQMLLERAVNVYDQAGADWLLMLGRFAEEVRVAHEVRLANSLRIKLCSFSTNTETEQAYSYLSGANSVPDSGQKMLVSNIREMLLWGLLDAVSGSDMVIIKPSTRLDVLTQLLNLFVFPDVREQFLESEEVEALIQGLPGEWAKSAIDRLFSHEGAIETALATYSISGVYSDDRDRAARTSEEMFRISVQERMLAALSAAGLFGRDLIIFDRTVSFIAPDLS